MFGNFLTLIPFILNILSASAFKTSTCTHEKLTPLITEYSNCTVNTIKPLVQSLAMKAGDLVEDSAIDSAIDKNCNLLKKTGPIMKCAKDTIGKCFSNEDLQTLKLAGQNSVLTQIQCYGNDDTQFVVEDDIFFSWLELADLFADKDASICTVEAIDNTNIGFQNCIENFPGDDHDVVTASNDAEKQTVVAINSIMKCFDATANPCFSEREMSFLRTEFQTAVEDTLGLMFGFSEHNLEDKAKTNAAAFFMANLCLSVTMVFFLSL